MKKHKHLPNLKATFLHSSMEGTYRIPCLILCETKDRVFLDFPFYGENMQQWFDKDGIELKRKSQEQLENKVKQKALKKLTKQEKKLLGISNDA